MDNLSIQKISTLKTCTLYNYEKVFAYTTEIE